VRVVIVEDASRFARDLMVQELGIAALLHRGVRLLTASGDDLTDTTDPLRKVMRQVAGAFHEYEKARLVAKLKGARDRKSAEAGKRIEGRKAPTAIIERCKALRASGAALQAISEALAGEGVVTSAGKPLDLAAISRYLRM
jgi:DNA invertase Pin-like site-specific DNA recombinase